MTGRTSRKEWTLAFCFVLVLGSLGFAQGMGSGSGNSGMSGGMGNGMGSQNGNRIDQMDDSMTGQAMTMSNGAFTVSADGKILYTLSRVVPAASIGSNTSVKTRLTAFDAGSVGSPKWSLVFNETWLTRPVEGPDGRLFLVSMSQNHNAGSTMSGSSGAEDSATLYIVSNGTLVRKDGVALDGEVASVPTIAGTDKNAYMVYIVTFDMGTRLQGMGSMAGNSRDSKLSAYDKDGKLLYSLPLE